MYFFLSLEHLTLVDLISILFFSGNRQTWRAERWGNIQWSVHNETGLAERQEETKDGDSFLCLKCFLPSYKICKGYESRKQSFIVGHPGNRMPYVQSKNRFFPLSWNTLTKILFLDLVCCQPQKYLLSDNFYLIYPLRKLEMFSSPQSYCVWVEWEERVVNINLRVEHHR